MRAITIDIGNTRIKAGFFENKGLHAHFICQHDELEKLSEWIKHFQPSHIISSSTAHESLQIDQIIPEDCIFMSLSPETEVPIEIQYDRKGLGQDRLANAMAGHAQNSKASLVIDAGTCVTYDWTAAGTYMGGSISPGVHMRLKAMHEFTGRLPLIQEITVPELIGSDTINAMSSGAFHGLKLEIQGIISEFKARYPDGDAFITGGDAFLLDDVLENDIFADPLLTLYGLFGILEYNHA